jgi:phenylacetate-CoA ligase
LASKTELPTDFDAALETADREQLSAYQLARLRHGVDHVLSRDNLTARLLRRAGVGAGGDIGSLADLAQLPLLSPAELRTDQTQHPPFGTNLTHELREYVRESVSPAAGVRWLDTRADLDWLTRLWQTAYAAIGLRPGDRVVHALPSAVPGSVAATDALPALSLLDDGPATVLLCTPSHALRLEASQELRLVVLGGEPGGNIPSTRRRIEDRLGARCADVYVSIEHGAIGWECAERRGGMHLNEGAFIVETLEVPGAPAGSAELVLTSLGRWGMPGLRYRTGDLVRLTRDACACGRGYVWADGGVLGRLDDLLEIRGVAILPSIVEHVVRRHPAVADYRLRVYDVRGACEMAVNVEADAAIATEGDQARVAAEVAEDLRRSLGVRLHCEAVPTGSLSRPMDDRPRRIDRRKRPHVAI